MNLASLDVYIKYLVPLSISYASHACISISCVSMSLGLLYLLLSILLTPENSPFCAAAMMSSIYDEHKDEDGFLYFTYSGENTFGGLTMC